MARYSYEPSWVPVEYGQIDTQPILEMYPLTTGSTKSGAKPRAKHPTAHVQLAALVESGKRWKSVVLGGRGHAQGCQAAIQEIHEAMGGKDYGEVIL